MSQKPLGPAGQFFRAAVVVFIAVVFVLIVTKCTADATKPVPGWTPTPSPSITRTQ